ncbi:MAG: LytTR family DNA-binding domain-containing protein [Cytophagales bacterium]|nr:LytTR family DNA-binding domain-containing protein [Bernardetiaceae bacterium]MDW8211850.1 LytTR family DNA-binding domain-containing protein [Cytophagales bacterium]
MMKIYKCIIVDDEPPAIEILQNYARKCQVMEVVATCNNAYQALQVLKEIPVDVLFLDIQLPELTGMEMLEQITARPATILTTAYSEYALKSYEFLNVVDYLLKPISYERFLKALLKIEYRANSGSVDNKFIFLKADKKYYKVAFEDIVFVESAGNYIKVHTLQQQIFTREKISTIENLLPPENFIRIHKSYIVALEFIDFVEGNIVKVGKYTLPIGDSYKNYLFSRITKDLKG